MPRRPDSSHTAMPFAEGRLLMLLAQSGCILGCKGVLLQVRSLFGKAVTNLNYSRGHQSLTSGRLADLNGYLVCLRQACGMLDLHAQPQKDVYVDSGWVTGLLLPKPASKGTGTAAVKMSGAVHSSCSLSVRLPPEVPSKLPRAMLSKYSRINELPACLSSPKIQPASSKTL